WTVALTVAPDTGWLFSSSTWTVTCIPRGLLCSTAVILPNRNWQVGVGVYVGVGVGVSVGGIGVGVAVGGQTAPLLDVDAVPSIVALPVKSHVPPRPSKSVWW